MRGLLAVLITVSLGWLPSQQAPAAILTVTNPIQADFTFAATAAGASLFPAPAGVPLPLRAVGNMTFAIDDDGTSSTAAFTNATGRLFGVSPPTPLPFLPLLN